MFEVSQARKDSKCEYHPVLLQFWLTKCGTDRCRCIGGVGQVFYLDLKKSTHNKYFFLY